MQVDIYSIFLACFNLVRLVNAFLGGFQFKDGCFGIRNLFLYDDMRMT